VESFTRIVARTVAISGCGRSPGTDRSYGAGSVRSRSASSSRGRRPRNRLAVLSSLTADDLKTPPSPRPSRFDGFVANYMGDGVLVYLAYPRAHEDDAEHALHRRRRSPRYWVHIEL